jgi:MFS family permease
MQSAWAIGYGLAAAVNALVLPRFGWRAVFLVGLLPALIVFWIRRHVEEPALWRASRREQNGPADLRDVFLGTRARVTWTVTAMHSATMFAWWGLFSWIPSYLTRPVANGGAGLSLMRSSIWIALMQVGMWLGYVSFGFVADRIGRKPAYVTYVLAAAALVPVYANAGESGLLIVGPCLAFFGTGYFSGFGAVTAELFPTSVRATAQGLTYNIGRLFSALAPYIVGSLAITHGLSAAFLIAGAAFLAAATLWIWIPETRGRALS